MTTATKWILGGGSILAVLTLSLLMIKGCGTTLPQSQVSGTQPSVPTTIIKDSSTTIRQQELVIIQSQSTIISLQDSLENLTRKLTGVEPQIIIRYKDTTKFRDTILFTIDSTKEDSLRKTITSSQGRLDSFIRSKRWIPVPKSFLDSAEFFKVKGTVTYSGVNINDLEIYNKTSVIIGQKSSFFTTGPVVVNVVESNPMLTSGQLQSFQYVPKTRKWTLVAGPAVIFNGSKFYQGIGLMAGYSIF